MARIADACWRWSGEFLPESTEDVTLRLKSTRSRAVVCIRVKTVVHGASVHLVSDLVVTLIKFTGSLSRWWCGACIQDWECAMRVACYVSCTRGSCSSFVRDVDFFLPQYSLVCTTRPRTCPGCGIARQQAGHKSTNEFLYSRALASPRIFADRRSVHIGACFQVFSNELPSFAPYRIDNFTSETLMMKQVRLVRLTEIVT